MAEQRRTMKVPEVAAALGIGQPLVRQMIRTGQLRSLRFGRRILIPREEIDRVLSEAS